MGVAEEGWAPAPLYFEKDDHLDNSVNAVSFGFVATAILISMFLVMAIFEKFLRNTSPLPDIEAHNTRISKLAYPPSPKICVSAREVPVVMPGNKIPTFIAHPAPVPCPPHQH